MKYRRDCALRMARRPSTTSRTTANSATSASRAGTPRPPRLGERLRQLRVGGGLTQAELAGDRFSKEYISQIERGKTRPTAETIEWLALRLGVDSAFLEPASRPTNGRAPRRSSPAPTRCSTSTRFDDALAEYAKALPAVLGTGAVELHVRALNGEGDRARPVGDVKAGLARLAEARALVERPEFSDVDRAEVVYRLGVCRYLLSSISTAVALFDEAFDARRAVRHAVRPAPPRRARVAVALLPPPARLRGRAGGRRARARARRGDARQPGARSGLLPGVGARRARRPLGARADVRREGQGAVRGARRPHQRRPAAEQPRRSRVPARQARAGGRASEARVLGRARGRARRGRRRPRSRRSRRSTSAPATPRAPRSRRATRSRSSASARTCSTRPATPSWCWVARCSSRTASTRPSTRSPTPRTASHSSRPRPTGPRHGSPRVTWRRRGATSAGLRVLYRRAAETLQDFRF